jgi:rubrerythrin
MSIKFNADEIFEMAEQMERNGAKFYRKAAETCSTTESRQTLLDLAAMEDEHEKTFASIRKSLTAQETAQTVFDPDNQAALYLRAFADGHVFDVKQEPCDRLTGRETMEEVLRFAMGLERDSIAFYLGIKASVPERLGRDKVEGIIQEEMSHVTLLSKQLRDQQAA